MRIPGEFYGTRKEVKSNCRKIITKLKRGATLAEVFEQSKYIDIDEYPDSLIWLDRGVLRPEPNFYLMEFSYSLREKDRLTQEQISKFKDENIEYLSTVDWGVLILNCPQAYFWIMKTPAVDGLYKKGYVAIIEGTVRFWDEYMSIGNRFYTGAGQTRYFNQTLPLCGNAVAVLGIDPGIGDKEDVPYTPGVPSWGNLKKLCLEAGVLEKLKYDDEFWKEVTEGKRAR